MANDAPAFKCTSCCGDLSLGAARIGDVIAPPATQAEVPMVEIFVECMDCERLFSAWVRTDDFVEAEDA